MIYVRANVPSKHMLHIVCIRFDRECLIWMIHPMKWTRLDSNTCLRDVLFVFCRLPSSVWNVGLKSEVGVGDIGAHNTETARIDRSPLTRARCWGYSGRSRGCRDLTRFLDRWAMWLTSLRICWVWVSRVLLRNLLLQQRTARESWFDGSTRRVVRPLWVSWWALGTLWTLSSAWIAARIWWNRHWGISKWVIRIIVRIIIWELVVTSNWWGCLWCSSGGLSIWGKCQVLHV